MCGGVTTVLLNDGMTRGPCIEMPNIVRAAELKAWLETPVNFALIKAEFEATTRFGKLLSLKVALAGNYVYVRFSTFTGDAMGMNMISKGCEKALTCEFPFTLLSLRLLNLFRPTGSVY